MIIALFALALAMIVGGLFSAILGWDIVLVERGWTMVIAGSVSAASGALLLGVTAIVSKLSQIQTELMRLQANLVEEEEPAALPSAAGISLAALAGSLFGKKVSETNAQFDTRGEVHPDLPLFAEAEQRGEDIAAAPASGRLDAVTTKEEASSRAQPAFERTSFFEPRKPLEADLAGLAKPLEPETLPAEEEPEAKVPDFLFVERFSSATYTEVGTPETDRSLYPSEPDREVAASEPEPASADLQQEEVFEPEAEPETQPEENVEEESRTRAVIGTYNSGDNKYVMYSDGSIEAETPQGLFQFKSLDELKEFIAAGGEGGARAT
ncbi:hypothetical protein [Microvirga sp. 2TAF3]|uniref:hypothetical protein n=1 Tax=Microvirga sp. 2TAF3 TaxID=3233014 RepID=UPI003F9AFEA9